VTTKNTMYLLIILRDFSTVRNLIMTPERVESAHVKYISVKYSILLLSGLSSLNVSMSMRNLFFVLSKNLLNYIKMYFKIQAFKNYTIILVFVFRHHNSY
jgi:hypothetical protein